MARRLLGKAGRPRRAVAHRVESFNSGRRMPSDVRYSFHFETPKVVGKLLQSSRMASPASVLRQSPPAPIAKRAPIDASMFVGIVIAIAATAAGIVATGIRPGYFLQPTGVL